MRFGQQEFDFRDLYQSDQDFSKEKMTKVGLENAVSTRELIMIYAGQVDSGYGSQVKDLKQQSRMMGTMVRETYPKNSVISI